jgi:hypothetical protein
MIYGFGGMTRTAGIISATYSRRSARNRNRTGYHPQRVLKMIEYIQKAQPLIVQKAEEIAVNEVSAAVDELMTPAQLIALVALAADLYIYQVGQTARAEKISFSV